MTADPDEAAERERQTLCEVIRQQELEQLVRRVPEKAYDPSRLLAHKRRLTRRLIETVASHEPEDDTEEQERERLLNEVVDQRFRAQEVERGSLRGQQVLRDRTATLEAATVAAVKEVGWAGAYWTSSGRFRRQAACQRVLRNPPDALKKSVAAAKLSLPSLSTMLRHTRSLAAWTREQCMSEPVEGPAGVYRVEKARRGKT